MSDRAPDGLPIYELGDPAAAYGISAHGGGYVIVSPPVGMDVSESDRALVVAEQRLNAIRRLALEAHKWSNTFMFAEDILGVLDSDGTQGAT